MLMKALDFIQIFASNVRRLDFRLSSAQVILAVIAGYRRTAPLRKLHACTPIPSPISCRISLRRDTSTVLETAALMFTGPLRMENSLPETCWTKIHSPAHEQSPAQYRRKTPLAGPRFPGRGRRILSGGQNSRRWWKTPNWRPFSRKRRNSNASGK